MDDSNEKESKVKDHIGPFPVLPTPVTSSSLPLVAVPVIHDEEYATELAEPLTEDVPFPGIAEPISRTWGWAALVVSILSLFILPVIFGSAGIVLGIIAFFRGNVTLGGWSMAIGFISIFTSLVLVPIYT
jgi:hypothetical protein